MILVCGNLSDHVVELVCARLADCGYRYVLLDTANFPMAYRLNVAMLNGKFQGFISGHSWQVALEDISGVFVRLHKVVGGPTPGQFESNTAAALALERFTALVTLLDGLACPIANRLMNGMSNYSKPYQALLIREMGLLTPPTLVTNDLAAARRFIDQADGEVICKAISGEGSIVRRVEPRHLDRLHLLQNGPVQFQHRIIGENIRVHTVGRKLFATLVKSTAIDYRHPSQDDREVEMEPCELPIQIEKACLALAERLGLELAGIDLMRTPTGEYFCFEANPAPAFLFYERLSGQPISLALAKLLHAGIT